MADPLSIAASVAGILSSVGKICGTLGDFGSSMVDAPNSVESTLNSMEEIMGVIVSVQHVMNSLNNLPTERKVLIQLDHLAITVTNCILTVSELESVVCRGSGFRHRLQWVWEEKKVLRLLTRLDSQKYSLTLMMNVLQCHSDLEAVQYRDKLQATVNQLLVQNTEIADRLQYLETTLVEDGRSVKFMDTDSTMSIRRMSYMDNSTIGNIHQQLQKDGATPFELRRDFEIALEKSRVYNRSQSSEPDMSVRGSTILSNSLSVLSELSLNDISILAVFRIPLTLNDIDKFGPDLTFGALLAEKALHVGDMEKMTMNPSKEIGLVSSTVQEKAELQDTKAIIPSIKPPQKMLIQETGVTQPSSNISTEVPVATLKVLVVGDKNTHKSEFITTYTTKRPTALDDYIPAVFDNYGVSVRIKDDLYTVGIFDTKGQEEYSRLRPLSYPQTDVFIVTMHQAYTSTADNVEELWIPEITHHCPGIPFIVANVILRADDPKWEEKRVRLKGDSKAYGKSIAEKMGATAYFECDLMDVKGVSAVFDEAIVTALENIQKPKHKVRKSKDKRRSWRSRFLRNIPESGDE